MKTAETKSSNAAQKRVELRGVNGQANGTSAEAGLVTLAAGAVGLGLAMLQQSEAEAATTQPGFAPETDGVQPGTSDDGAANQPTPEAEASVENGAEASAEQSAEATTPS